LGDKAGFEGEELGEEVCGGAGGGDQLVHQGAGGVRTRKRRGLRVGTGSHGQSSQ
jgi:hypothetical protein